MDKPVTGGVSANGAARYQPGATPQENGPQMHQGPSARPIPMPQSLANVVLHLVFSTKDRHPVLSPSVRSSLHAYLATLVRSTRCECPRVGGTSDHVHLAIRLCRTVAIADLVEKIKTSSSKWLKSQTPELHGFAWQRGYGVLSTSPAAEHALLQYIDNQAQHHISRTFQDEYREILRTLGVAFDERYMWD